MRKTNARNRSNVKNYAKNTIFVFFREFGPPKLDPGVRIRWVVDRGQTGLLQCQFGRTFGRAPRGSTGARQCTQAGVTAWRHVAERMQQLARRDGDMWLLCDRACVGATRGKWFSCAGFGCNPSVFGRPKLRISVESFISLILIWGSSFLPLLSYKWDHCNHREASSFPPHS